MPVSLAGGADFLLYFLWRPAQKVSGPGYPMTFYWLPRHGMTTKVNGEDGKDEGDTVTLFQSASQMTGIPCRDGVMQRTETGAMMHTNKAVAGHVHGGWQRRTTHG